MPLTWKDEIELRWDAFYQDKLIEDLKNKVKGQEIEIYSLNGKLTKSNSLLRKSKKSQEDLKMYINLLKKKNAEKIANYNNKLKSISF